MSHMQASMLYSSSPSPSPRTKKGNQKDMSSKALDISPIITGRQQQSNIILTSPHDQSPKFQKPKSRSPGLQKSSSMNRKVTQSEPSPKASAESFEMVRSKMRESIAASLKMAYDESSKAEDEVNNFATGSLTARGEGEVEALPGEESYAMNVFNSSAKLLGLSENETRMNGDDVQEYHQLDVGPVEQCSIFGENFVAKVDILQEKGLFQEPNIGDTGDRFGDRGHRDSKRPKLGRTFDSDPHHVEEPQMLATKVESCRDCKFPCDEELLVLATKIEVELFELFGGVNKKYKEKGRSLLFNLKDRNNPELRRHVLVGEIAPKRLCCMTAEELASKELSQWRIAKAEELAQMVVLPDSDVDIRRLVKKTHKGEFQVEYEHDDSAQVDTTVTANSFLKIPSKRKQNEMKRQESGEESGSPSYAHETELCKGLYTSEKVIGEEAHLSNAGTSPSALQDVEGEGSKCSGASEVPTFDEFTEVFSKRPPFENLLVTNSDGAISDEENPEKSAIVDTEQGSSKVNLDSISETDNLNFDTEPTTAASVFLPECRRHGTVFSSDAQFSNTKATVDNPGCEFSAQEVMNYRVGPQQKDDAIEGRNSTDIQHTGYTWEGLVQLTVSSLVAMLGVYKSGEQASTTDWPTFLEIKGRVRLDAFKKFLQELPMSKSREVTVLQFCWKEGSPEDGRDNLHETINSYVADERVGYAEPAPGVEIYFCPPHEKVIAVLVEHLSKDHVEIVKSIDSGFIGVVVWRRPLVSNSQHRSGSKKQSSQRKQKNVNADSCTTCPVSVQHVSCMQESPSVAIGNEPIDDAPPGFGPGVSIAERDDDDLPEFNFSRAECNPSCASVPALPVEQMRQLVHKFGENANTRTGTGMWNADNDDDIPEWKSCDSQPQPSICHPPLPPGPPPQLLAYQNQMQASISGQHIHVSFQQQQPSSPQSSHLLPNFMPQQLLHQLASFPVGPHLASPQMMFLQSPPPALLAGWQLPGQWWRPAPTPAFLGFGGNGMVRRYTNNEAHPPIQGHPPGSGYAAYHGWGSDVPRNR